jgi:hypothetical protein
MIQPVFELDPSGGQVVVTRFECPSLRTLGFLFLLHHRVKRSVRKQSTGFLGVRTVIDWRRRVLLSVSLWIDIESIYTMGDVMEHVLAARVPRKLGVATACGVYCFAGDWRRVMFQVRTAEARSPLRQVRPPRAATARKEYRWTAKLVHRGGENANSD